MVTAGEKEAITGKEPPNKENEGNWKVNGLLHLNRDEVSLLVSSKACCGLVPAKLLDGCFGLAENPQPDCLDLLVKEKWKAIFLTLDQACELCLTKADVV